MRILNILNSSGTTVHLRGMDTIAGELTLSKFFFFLHYHLGFGVYFQSKKFARAEASSLLCFSWKICRVWQFLSWINPENQTEKVFHVQLISKCKFSVKSIVDIWKILLYCLSVYIQWTLSLQPPRVMFLSDCLREVAAQWRCCLKRNFWTAECCIKPKQQFL